MPFHQGIAPVGVAGTFIFLGESDLIVAECSMTTSNPNKSEI